MASSGALYSAVESIKVDATDAFSNLEADSGTNLEDCLGELQRLEEKVPKAIAATKLMIEAAEALA